MLLNHMKQCNIFTVSYHIAREGFPGKDPHPYEIFAETMHNRETGRTDVSQVRVTGEEEFRTWAQQQGWAVTFSPFTGNFVLQKIKKQEPQRPLPVYWLEEDAIA